ncbi:unnamed protein product [Cylicocyclus nassatus]|uniref:Alpha-carbonic anhydrase domain-containing protein n=1 Tax=Cylicocyclus nassatus TaxID=53992 RepID=A0AA36DU86_CYLNA|nr:unnamed protein product [Cylicocyclus nassatus]
MAMYALLNFLFCFQLTFSYFLPYPFMYADLRDLRKAKEETWRHMDNHQWSGICSVGRSQSPVDLMLGDAEVVNYDSIHFNNYHLTGPVVVEHDGHGGGNLDATYYLRQLHFHWSSEHTFNGLRYPAELHLVHISNKYDPSRNMSLSGKVAVVAVPILVGDSFLAIRGLDALFLERNNSTDSKLSEFSPSVLVPDDTKTFYRYSGSLTTPPCTEGVTWTILTEPVLMSSQQLNALKSAHGIGEEEEEEEENIRPIQPMNGRKLLLNKAGKILIEGDTMTKVLLILGSLVLLLVAPPLVVLWVIYKKATIANLHRDIANSSNSLPTIESDSHSEESNTQPETSTSSYDERL